MTFEAKLKSLLTTIRIGRAAVLWCALICCVSAFDCAAQSQQVTPKKNGLPRVGTIKDYPATGLMTGCGNLYFYPAASASRSDAAYVFLARGDGSNAWMNLGGRDVRLRQVKSPRRDNLSGHRYHYRAGNLRISVLIESFKPKDEPVVEEDSMFKMRITLRKGGAVRIVKAVGDSDC